MNPQERKELLAAYLVGALEEPQRETLLAELRADSTFAHNAAELLVIDRLLKTELAASDGRTFAREVVERLKAGPPRRAFAANVVARVKALQQPGALQPPRTISRRLPWSALAAAVVMIGVGVGLLLLQNRPPSGQPAHPTVLKDSGVDPERGQRIVAAGAPVTKELDGYCKLVLAPNSALVIMGGPKARKLALEQGHVECAIKKNEGTFAVESRLGIVSVRGTEFAVDFTREKEGEIAWGSQLSVQVLKGTVLLASAWGPKVTLSDEKDAPKEGGVLTGILTDDGIANKRGPWIEVLADGQEESTRYVPGLVDGYYDDEMVRTFARLYLRNRVKLVWAYGAPRQVVAVEIQLPTESSGRVTGEVVHKGSIWMDVKPKDGPLDRYTRRLAKTVNEADPAFSQTNEGDTVTVDWSYVRNDCKRIEGIQKAGR